ncbi:hypothetical protein [Magnetospira sp. QH-2]|uniref:hypothetical protein n=1 Tax=Magnetospira sp. (strain QH-2) TaxID=1288970 RepID=UPI0003E816FF|nr:hypothetical protein [Magnetospira sp. QH-2]CCQ72427.1 Conserved protein of unknown function [Magnetospira sp. QH-2]
MAQTKSKDAFIQQLKSLLASHRAVMEGRIFQLDLSAVKEDLGEKWDKIAKSIDRIVVSILDLRLSASDVFMKQDPTHYLVAFATTDSARARLKLALVAQEVGQRVLGLSWHENAGLVKSLTLDENDEIKVEDYEVDKSAIEETKPSATAKARGGAQLFPGLDHVAEDEGKIGFMFRPMWYVKRKVITTYLCVPAITSENSSFRCGYNVLPKPSDPKQIAFLDNATAKRLSQEFKSLAQKNMAPLLTMPVHYETLFQPQARIAFIKTCREHLDKNRKHVVLEIVGLPEGIPFSHLQEITQAVRPLCRAVMGRVRRGVVKLPFHREAGLHGVGIDLSVGGHSEDTIIQEFDAFVSVAAENDLHTYVHGIGSLAQSTAAVCAGFDYVDGYAIANVADAARDIEVYDIRDPYKKRLDR